MNENNTDQNKDITLLKAVAANLEGIVILKDQTTSEMLWSNKSIPQFLQKPEFEDEKRLKKIETAYPAPYIWQYCDKSEHKIWQITEKIINDFEGKTVRYTHIIDITNVEGMEESHRTLLAEISQEIRTPLNAIQGFSEILMSKLKKSASPNSEAHNKYYDFIYAIHKNSEELHKIVNTLLHPGAVEEGLHKSEEESTAEGVAQLESAFEDIEMITAMLKKSPELKLELEKKLFPMYEKACQTKTINMIRSFAKETRLTGEYFKIPFLYSYGDKLYNSTTQFKFEKLLVQLPLFEKFIIIFQGLDGI